MVVACGATLAYTGEAAGSVIYYVVVLTITGAVGAFVYRVWSGSCAYRSLSAG